MPVPGGVPGLTDQTSACAPPVIIRHRWPACLQLEPGDEPAARHQVPRTGNHCCVPPVGCHVWDDVAGEHHGVEPSCQIEFAEVGVYPGQVGRLRAGQLDHVSIDIDPDDLHATAAQLNGHPTGAAAPVQHAASAVGNHAICFT